MMRMIVIAICCLVVGCALSFADNGNTADDTADRMGIAEEFDMLYQSLKEVDSVYNADVMKTLAFLIVALGWFMTSDKSREFFRKNRVPRIAAIVALGVTGAIHIRYSYLMYESSQKLMSLLNSTNYIDSGRYAGYAIEPSRLVTNLIQNVVLFAVLVIILATLKAAPAEAQM